MTGNFAWPTAAPGDHGFWPVKLDALRGVLAARCTRAFLRVRHDPIVHKRYTPDFPTGRRHSIASLRQT